MIIRRFIDSQIWLSRRFDKFLPKELSVDGNWEFLNKNLPRFLKQQQTILDVGGGKNPFVDAKTKKELNSVLIGLDIDIDELKQAPVGTYDEIVCADISTFRGFSNEVDLAICQSVFEHIEDVSSAFQSISYMLKERTGTVVLFVPCKYAPFTILNRLLPEKLKKSLLYFFFPQTERDQGFKAYYDKCSPGEFRKLAEQNSLNIDEEYVYHESGYFTFFFPLHLVWRLWMLLHRIVSGRYPVEIFSMVLSKK